MSYNGWSNYETWVVNLWLDNDESAERAIRSEAVFMLKSSCEDYGAKITSEKTKTWLCSCDPGLGRFIQDMVNETAPDLDNSVFSDLLGSALGSVNWREIARAHLEAVVDEVIEEYNAELEEAKEEESEVADVTT